MEDQLGDTAVQNGVPEKFKPPVRLVRSATLGWSTSVASKVLAGSL